jgi:hypothetical protein
MGGAGLRVAGWALVAVGLCLVVVAVAWLIRSSSSQEAAGQEATTPVAPPTTTPSPETPATSPPASVPPLFPELEEALSSASAQEEAAEHPRGIPGLSVMDILGQLNHFPLQEGRFVCRGPVPGEEAGSNLWVCSVPSREGAITHDVTVVGDDPLTVLWLRATVRGATKEDAAEFFGYVGSLCLQGTDNPLDPEAWAQENLGGGQVLARGAEFSIYGTQEERVLQVVATNAF